MVAIDDDDYPIQYDEGSWWFTWAGATYGPFVERDDAVEVYEDLSNTEYPDYYTDDPKPTSYTGW